MFFIIIDYGRIPSKWQNNRPHGKRTIVLLMIQQQKGHFDMLEVMPDVPEKVREKFGIELELEQILWGDF